MQCSSLGSSLTQSTREPSAVSVLGLNPFGFESKNTFDASLDLTHSRSARFAVRPPEPDADIWRRKPPDFRLQVYNPNPPKRNSRDAMQPWKYGTYPGEEKPKKRAQSVNLPNIFKEGKEDILKNLDLSSSNLMGISDEKNHFVREGMYPAGPYSNPKDPDFRGLKPIGPLGLEEFDTSYEKDPYNIKFHTNNLQTIHGTGGKAPYERLTEGNSMATPLHQPPKWEQRLHMPNLRWRTPYCAYTRYRLPWRYPEQVIMDRVEESLNVKWDQEKRDSSLRKELALQKLEMELAKPKMRQQFTPDTQVM